MLRHTAKEITAHFEFPSHPVVYMGKFRILPNIYDGFF